MNEFLNLQRLQAGNILNAIGTIRTGIVDTFDPTTFTCVVQFEPENSDSEQNSLSPNLPIAALAIGNGFGILAAPNIGDRVAVHFIGGSNSFGFVCCGLFNNDVDIPPSINAGEYYLIHQSGSFIKLMNTGKLLLNGNTEIDLTAPKVTITTTGDMDVNVGGNLNATVTGATNIDSTGDITLQSATTTVTGNLDINGTLTANNGSISVSGGDITTSGGIAAAQTITSNTDVTTGSISLKTHVHSGVTTGGSNTGAPV